jgi:hypothetical protein
VLKLRSIQRQSLANLSALPRAALLGDSLSSNENAQTAALLLLPTVQTGFDPLLAAADYVAVLV